jgi:transcriptional regulator with XRE-family HTH domain
MAKVLDIDKTSYGHIESGKTKLSVERFEKIAEELGTTCQAIDELDFSKIFHIINHQGNAGQVSIHNSSLEEVAKVLTEPYKQQIATLEKLLVEKDKQLANKDEEIHRLQNLLKQQA